MLLLIKVLMGLAALFALYHAIFKVKLKYAKWITIALSIAVGMTLIPWVPIALDGGYAYILLLFIGLIYTFAPQTPEFSNRKKLILAAIMGIPFVTMVLELNHYPGVAILSGFTVLSLGAFVYAFTSLREEFHNEIGMLVIPAMDSFVRVSLLLMSFFAAH